MLLSTRLVVYMYIEVLGDFERLSIQVHVTASGPILIEFRFEADIVQMNHGSSLNLPVKTIVSPSRSGTSRSGQIRAGLHRYFGYRCPHISHPAAATTCDVRRAIIQTYFVSPVDLLRQRCDRINGYQSINAV